MNKEIADKWIDALRSGKYQQSRSALKTENGFCCLGVLCEISGLDKFVKRASLPIFTFLGVTGVLPTEVVKWAEMKSPDGRIDDATLVVQNDSGKTFEQIANAIEQNWERL